MLVTNWNRFFGMVEEFSEEIVKMFDKFQIQGVMRCWKPTVGLPIQCDQALESATAVSRTWRS